VILENEGDQHGMVAGVMQVAGVAGVMQVFVT